MRPIVLVVLMGGVCTGTAAGAEPAACRPLRPTPAVTPAAAVEIRSLPAPLSEEREPEIPDAGLDPTGTSADPSAGTYPVQRVAAAPWAYMKCVPPAPCRTPCYADNIRCEARMFRSTAPRCHCQAFHRSLQTAVRNALDLPHAMHECCRKIHNTCFTPDPYQIPYPYNECSR
ncbi:MAG TPA: hypothetical protein VML55_18235 [Planctomycetaceae bacterium]|nr:hypothetical protein [Planctomycetaceae bacterium]